MTTDPPGSTVTLTDARDRALRCTSHADRGLLVVSVWSDGRCVGSVRLGPEQGDVLRAWLDHTGPALATDRG